MWWPYSALLRRSSAANRSSVSALYAAPEGLLGVLMSTAAVDSSSSVSAAAKSIWKSSQRGGTTDRVRPAPST